MIRVITNKPDLNSILFSSDVAALFSQYGAPSQHIQTMLNVPIIAGTLGLRFAGDVEHSGGWVDEPEANAKNVNSSNVTNARLEALWRPGEDLSVNATEIIRRETFGVGYGEDANGDIQAPLVFGLTTTPEGSQAFTLSNLAVNYSVAGVRLLSSSTYFTHTFNWNNVFVVGQLSPALSEDILFRSQAATDRDFSEEVRIDNARAGRWQWMIGGFYKHYTDTGAQNDSIAYSPPLPPVINLSYAGLDTGSNSQAAFVNTSYRVTQGLEFGGGVRYYKAHETYNEPSYNYMGYAGLGLIPGKFEEGDFASTDPRLYFRYALTPHVNAYVSASKGFREGGFNGPGLPNYQPETLWRYDFGVKTRELNNSLQSDIDFFYSNYSNYVVEGYFPALNNYYHANAGTAHIKGVDAGVKWRFAQNWRLSATGEWVDAKFVSITALDTGYSVGEEVPLVTKYSLSTSIERDFQWGEKPGYVTLSYSEVSGVQDSTVGYIYPIAQSDVMRLLNVNSSLALSGNVSIGLFARNLLNDRGYLDPYAIYGEGTRQEPRTFGVEFRVDVGGK